MGMDQAERIQLANVSRVLEQLLHAPLGHSRSNPRGDYSALRIAKALRAGILEREQTLPFLPSCSPGWRILIELYIAQLDSVRVSISDIGHDTGLAGATPLRWLKLLEENGLVTRHADHADRRRFWLHLTPLATDAVSHITSNMTNNMAHVVNLALPG